MPERNDRHGWIDLLVPDGPFLSAGALDVQTVGENWPTRLSAEHRATLMAPPASEADEGAEWDDSSWDGRRARALELLTELLGYRQDKTLAVAPGVTAHHHIYRARVSADFLIHAADDSADARMVVICGPDATEEPTRLNPSRTHNHDGWVSTPVQRAALLARHAGADLALVTNGREHLLVNVVTGTTGSAMWTVNGLEDRHARDAFVALLHRHRILHRTASLSRLIELSQDRQHELTDTLGKQVRRAAEALVNAISRANRTSRGRLLDGLTGQQVYAGTTRVLMRSVFLLVAEERGLLPVAENPLFADQYAMSTLLDKLEEDAYRNRSAMERRSGAWQRMMALSRAVHAGIEHDDLRLPAYGGNLFDPDEHPFLEARVLVEGDNVFEHVGVGVVDDFTVLTVLRHLQIANGQRISFRSLDVEQIGHVYEALLDHSAVIVPEGQVAVLGLVGRAGDEPEVPLVELEGWSAKSDKELGKQLVDIGVAAEERGVYNALDAGLAPDSGVAQTLNVAVANDQVLRERVEPYAPLLRTDARGVALVFLPGDVYVTETSSKRDSGTAYTPRSLADEIAKHTLDPLIYDPGPQNEPNESEWKLRSPGEILDLKICDPAVGSAAILVAAVRYLAEALLQARVGAGDLSPEVLNSGASDAESVDVRVQARRAIVARSVYGVDRDPMAVEMAKLSLWLITLARDEPFTFLDHAIRHGDSLLGISSLDQLRRLHLAEDTDIFGLEGGGLFADESLYEWRKTIDEAIAEARQLRKKLHQIKVHDVADAMEQASLHNAAQEAAAALRTVADAVVAACLVAADSRSEVARKLASMTSLLVDLDRAEVRERLAADAAQRAEAGNPTPQVPRSFLHWPLEFPEVWEERHGFDAVVGNPPFMGGTELGSKLGRDYFAYIKTFITGGQFGRADLVAAFFLRSQAISSASGFLSTSSISQGDSHSLLRDALGEWTIFRAEPSQPWPGAANVHIAKVWWRRSSWQCDRKLGGRVVPYISAALTSRRSSDVDVDAIGSNLGYAVGFEPGISQFNIDPEHPLAMQSDLVHRMANASDLNGARPKGSTLVLDFELMSESEARTHTREWEYAEAWIRPAVFAKPASYRGWRDRWWQFWNPRERLREMMERHDQLVCLPRTSKHAAPFVVSAQTWISKAIVAFDSSDLALFGLLHSEAHYWWVIERSSKLKSDIRYSPSDCFSTFPMPAEMSDDLRATARAVSSLREALAERAGGLTLALNMVHDPTVRDPDVYDVRAALKELNRCVMEVYGFPAAWGDLGFYEIEGRTLRLTMAPGAMDAMLDALTELNLEITPR